jgi:hypothetical protein
MNTDQSQTDISRAVKSIRSNPLKKLSIIWILFVMVAFYKTIQMIDISNPDKKLLIVGFLVIYPIVAAWRIRHWLFR